MKKINFFSVKSSMQAFFGAILILAFSTSTSFAQDEQVSDEELRKYAVVMDSIDGMKQNIQTEYNELIQEEELMQGGRRFVEIQKIGEDSVRLAEINVTEMELEAFNRIQEKYEEMTAEFKENYTNLIKDELGAATYNKVTKAIKADNEVKERYESILEEVRAENGQQTDDEDAGEMGREQGQTGESDETGGINQSE